MAELLYRLGRLSQRRPWVTIAAWLVLLGIAGGGFALGFKGLTSSFDIPGTDAGTVIGQLENDLPEFSGMSGTAVYTTDDGSAMTDAQRDAIAELAVSITDLDHVESAVDPFDAAAQLEDQRQQIDDGRAQLEDGRAQAEAGLELLEAAGQPTDEAEAALDQIAEQQAQLDQAEELLGYADGIGVVSSDESTAVVNITFTEPQLELPESAREDVIEHFESAPIDGLNLSFSSTISQGIPEILGVGEVVGVAVAAIVLVVVLGSLIAAAFPIVTAIVGVGMGAMSVLAFSGVVSMTSVTPVLGVMLGLAVGIDYALFIIYRHRSQLIRGLDVDESIALANGTAGNAVVFAGSTVIVALLALIITGIPFLGLMGIAGAVSVAFAVLIAISLTPALLGLAGMRILSRGARERARAANAAGGISTAQLAQVNTSRRRGARSGAGEPKQMSTARAVITTVLAIGALLVIAVPTSSMHLGLPDGGSEAEDSPAYQAYVTTEEAFGAGANGPLLVVATVPDAVGGDDLLVTQLEVARVLAEQNDVAAVAPVGNSDDGTTLVFQVVPREGPNTESTEQLVHALRALPPVGDDIELGVSGQAAINIDISASLDAVLPIYLVVVVGLSILIMIMVFRSLLVPIVATGGFVLSLLATYGAVTAVFQWGWLGDFFGIHNPGPILSFLPIILVGILFGLAMDYQLFLATGMREAYVHGSPAREAVARGFRAGRTVVIAAALIMIAVFGGFITSESVMIKSMGFGLAVGVLFDAFVVRLLLMPAIMHLLGRSAWWLPGWLDKLIPNVDVEGAALERRHPGRVAPNPAS